MSLLKFILFECLLFCLQTSSYTQTTVQVQGLIKSQQGAIQGASVEFVKFINSREVILDHCITELDGRFSSKVKIAFDKNIYIKVFKEGYKNIIQNNYYITKNGFVGEIKLQPSITISGTVIDSSNTDRRLQDAEVFYYFDGKLVKVASTNNKGYFDFEPSFASGKSIRVQVSKKGYYDKEQTMTISSEGQNIMNTFLLPPDNSRGLIATFQVNDKITGKPLKGVTLHYYDQKIPGYRDTTLSNNGEVEIRLLQRPGLYLNLEIRKLKYKTVVGKVPIMENPFDNHFPFALERSHNSVLAPALLTGSGVSALGSVVMFVLSTQQYKRYRKFDNGDRDNDYTEAQRKRTISAIAAGVGVAALGGYIITRIIKIKQDRRDNNDGTKSAGKISILKQSYCYKTPALGLSYHF